MSPHTPLLSSSDSKSLYYVSPIGLSSRMDIICQIIEAIEKSKWLRDVDMIQESVKRLLDRVNNEENHTCEFPPSIYMAPSILRDLSPSSFNPQLVSIGPLHREDENVKAFEGQKISHLINLMSYINSPQEEILESCMQKAYNVMNEIKGCYLWTKTFSDAEIAEMMVLDACFILGFIIYERVLYQKNICRKKLQYRTIMNDLVLLENQIPLFFLDQMFQPTLTMPVLSVHDSTELLFRNHIAYEQSFPTQCYVSSYASVMDKLVNTQDDVAKLVESKVLINIMGSNKEAANMINKICKKVIVSNSYYEEEWDKLNKYCNGSWPKHIAKMRSTYFSSPWSIIALVAGIIRFVLQSLQTIFTIKS
ncbi:hypothetical protein R6Q59_026842 [Mikania micrantha]